MILLREIQDADLSALEALAQIPGFINLVADTDVLKYRIRHSAASFSDSLANKMEAKFIFVAEDLETKKVLGTSMIAAQHGTAESPHFYFEVGNEKKFADTINTGFIHGTLHLKYDTNGPSEIGGLVVDPDYRNSDERLGRQISFVRFLYLGMNKPKFKRRVIAELLPPLNKKGLSPLWEAIGRRFTNMDYWEADELCQKNKEFIFSLFPTGKIYTTFFPAEARNAIGKVGKATEPVYHMLTKIGFKYKNQVDPFDGGPHLWANVDEIVPIKKMSNYKLDRSMQAGEKTEWVSGLITRADAPKGQFRALSAKVVIKDKQLNFFEAARGELACSALGLKDKDPLVFMPYY
ncbi:MAG: arginine N-succinyltransferase [Bacteriovoracia bacterium]